MLNWGATKEEIQLSLPGDSICQKAQYTITLGETINALPEDIWPWVVQMGQDRAAFYTYTFLENLFLSDMHNANQIVPEWQKRAIGDFVPTCGAKLDGK